MTGPEKRVLSGYHALGQTKIIDETLYEQTPTIKSVSNFSLNELMHNLNIILDMCEQVSFCYHQTTIEKKTSFSNCVITSFL